MSYATVIRQAWRKAPLVHKVFYGMTIVFILMLFYNLKHQGKEGYEQQQAQSKELNIKDDPATIYDDFYVEIYDDLLFSKNKNDFEISEIVKATKPSAQSRILDIGSGTGHHVSALDANGFTQVQGIDMSASMVTKAKSTYPTLDFAVGNALETMLFPGNSFTHITCLYFTIYYIQDKLLFFRNCLHWLAPGGYLILHLVEPNKFDPIMPAGDPFPILSPQHYAEKRITQTTVKFDQFDYKANFKMEPVDEKDEKPLTSANAILTETFKMKPDGGVRKNEHRLYMPAERVILRLALHEGFIVVSKSSMLKCQYENQNLYVLQKPT